MDSVYNQSKQAHRFNPLGELVSSSPVATPVPFAPTGDTSVEEVSNLGKFPILPRHVGDVSSACPSDSVTHISNAVAPVLSHPVGGRLQALCQTWAFMGASHRVVPILRNSDTLPFQTKPPLTKEPLIQNGYAIQSDNFVYRRQFNLS